MKRLENKKEKRTIGLELIKILILEKVAEQTGCAQVAGRQEPRAWGQVGGWRRQEGKGD